jgi:hypothetical protein
MDFIDEVGAEELLKEAGSKTAGDRGRRTVWGFCPFSCGGGGRGVLVLGRGEEIGPQIQRLIRDIAWQTGKMMELRGPEGSPS